MHDQNNSSFNFNDIFEASPQSSTSKINQGDKDIKETIDSIEKASSNNVENTFESALNKLPPSIRDLFKEQLKEVANYTPKIGIMGKSGAGKSSLANAIVGKPVFETGGVGGCTRHFQEETITISANRKMTFMDLPGIGESEAYRDEYENLYKEKTKELDIIIWAIKIDDRANEIDGRFYRWLTQYYKKEQILFVLTQADKAEPSYTWVNSEKEFGPSVEQSEIIRQNRERISRDFNISIADVIPVTTHYHKDKGLFCNYNLELLITCIIQKVPKKAKSSVYANVEKKNRTEEAKIEAQEGFGSVAGDIFDAVVEIVPLPEPVKKVVKAAKGLVVTAAKSIWNRIFG